MTKIIPLTQGKIALVDDEDYEYINQWKWCYHSEGYAKNNSLEKMRFMHREILHIQDKVDIDHINGNKLDNRKENLRVCSRSQNMANSKKHKNSTSKYKGVSWSRSKKRWRVTIMKNRKAYFLGLFDNPVDAATAYDKKALELSGEFAKLNFPV